MLTFLTDLWALRAGLRLLLTFLTELWAQRVCMVLGLLRGRFEEGHDPIWEYDRPAGRTWLRCTRCLRVREVRL